jgi:hypothetical protein
MSQPALQTLSRTGSLVGGLLWGCLAPVFVYTDSALDEPGTAGFALAVSSMWLAALFARASARWSCSTLAIRS